MACDARWISADRGGRMILDGCLSAIAAGQTYPAEGQFHVCTAAENRGLPPVSCLRISLLLGIFATWHRP